MGAATRRGRAQSGEMDITICPSVTWLTLWRGLASTFRVREGHQVCDNQLKWERVKDARGCDFSTLSLAADGPRGEADLWVPSPLVAQLTDEVVTSGGFPMRGGDFRKPQSWCF